MIDQSDMALPEITQTSVSDFTTDLTDILDNTRSTIVTVSSGSRIGSGFVYSREENDVYLITSSDLYADSGEVLVSFDSSTALNAEIVGRDDVTGVMLLKVQPSFEVRTSRLGDSSLLEQGEYVLALSGRRSATGNSVVSFGIVSEPGQRRLSAASLWQTGIIETDAAIVQEMIGGPLLDQGGAVVGMLARSAVGTDRLSIAVSINEIRLAAEELKTDGAVSRGSLGIVCRSVSDLRSYEKSSRGLRLDDVSGVLVIEAEADGELQAGDVLQQINGEPIADADSLRTMLYGMQAGDTAELTVLRNNEQITLSVVLE